MARGKDHAFSLLNRLWILVLMASLSLTGAWANQGESGGDSPTTAEPALADDMGDVDGQEPQFGDRGEPEPTGDDDSQDDMDEVEPEPMEDEEDDWCGLWDEARREHPTDLPDLLVEILEDLFSDPTEDDEVPEDEEDLPCLVLIYQDLIDLWPTLSVAIKDQVMQWLPISEHPKYFSENLLCDVDWATCDDEAPHILFHWNRGSPLEPTIRELCEWANDKAWPKLTEAWAFPPSDEACPCNGGDGRLDYYISNLKGPGITHFRMYCVDADGETRFSATAEECNEIIWCDRSAFVVLSPWRIRENIDVKKMPIWNHQTVAHELAHTIQLNYGPNSSSSNGHWRDDWSFWQEATATWAEDFVYEDGQFEHLDARTYFANVDLSYRRQKANSDFAYGAYLLPFFWAGEERKIDDMKRSWEVYEVTADLYQAIEFAVPDAWASEWDRFAVEMWNQEPVDGFQAMDWDDLTDVRDRPSTQLVEIFIDDDEAEFAFEPTRHAIQPLSLNYFDIVVKDESVRQVVVANPFFEDENSPNVSVQALVQIGDEWMEEPVSLQDLEGLYFCRDKEEENVNRVILIVAGRLWTTPDRKPFEIPDGPWVVANRIGCDTWTGTVSTTIRNQHASGHQSGDCVDFDSTLELSADLTYERALPATPRPKGNIVFSQFQRVAGVLRWSYRGSFRTTPPCIPGQCTFSESGEIVLGADERDESILSIAGSHAFGDTGLDFGQYFVGHSVDISAAELGGCSATEEGSVEGLTPALREALQPPRLVGLPFWVVGLEDGEALGSDGSALQGSQEREMPSDRRGSITTESSWSLTTNPPGPEASTDSDGDPQQD